MQPSVIPFSNWTWHPLLWLLLRPDCIPRRLHPRLHLLPRALHGEEEEVEEGGSCIKDKVEPMLEEEEKGNCLGAGDLCRCSFDRGSLESLLPTTTTTITTNERGQGSALGLTMGYSTGSYKILV